MKSQSRLLTPYLWHLWNKNHLPTTYDPENILDYTYSLISNFKRFASRFKSYQWILWVFWYIFTWTYLFCTFLHYTVSDINSWLHVRWKNNFKSFKYIKKFLIYYVSFYFSLLKVVKYNLNVDNFHVIKSKKGIIYQRLLIKERD